MDSISNLPPHQKAEFMQFMEEKQLKDSLIMYNMLVENCFDKCTVVGWNGNFTSKVLESGESKCITNCAEKYLKLTQRVGMRFAEFQSQQQK